jgi:hypothetical protein
MQWLNNLKKSGDKEIAKISLAEKMMKEVGAELQKLTNNIQPRRISRRSSLRRM